MLPPEIEERFGRILARRAEAAFSDEEFVALLGDLATADNIGSLLDSLPHDLPGGVKRAIARRAADNECLVPEKSPFETFGQYYCNVSEALLEPDNRKRSGLLSVVCLPSFQVEWALRLLGSEKRGYSLAVNVAQSQIWSSNAASPVAVKRMETIVPADLGAVVCQAWRKMLLRVRHPEIGRVGLDGVRYHFACRGPGMGCMAGTTWSPRPQTAPGKLVDLSHLLYRYVEEGEPGREGLTSEIRQAAEWFVRLT